VIEDKGSDFDPGIFESVKQPLAISFHSPRRPEKA
jgi:hypothetical protein